MKRYNLRVEINYTIGIISKVLDKNYYEGEYEKHKGPYINCYFINKGFDVEDIERFIYDSFDSETVLILISKVLNYIDCRIEIKHTETNYNCINSNKIIIDYITEYYDTKKIVKRPRILDLKNINLKKISCNNIFNPGELPKELDIFKSEQYFKETFIKKIEFTITPYDEMGDISDIEIFVAVGKLVYSWFLFCAGIYGIIQWIKSIFNVNFQYKKNTEIYFKAPLLINTFFTIGVFLLSVLSFTFLYPILKKLILEWRVKYIEICGSSITLDIDIKTFYSIYFKSLFLTVITLGLYLPKMIQNLNEYIYSSYYIPVYKESDFLG